MITIVHVVDLSVPNPWLNGVALNHDRNRFRHVVVSLGPRCGLHESLEKLSVTTYALNATGYHRTLVAVARLRHILQGEKANIVQTHLFHPTTVGLAAATISGTQLKIVTRHHSDFTTVFRRPVHRRIDRYHAMTADRVMAASHAVKRAMLRYERVPEAKIAVTPYGYDFTNLRPRLTSSARGILREQMGGDDRVLVATVARLSIEKGHRYLFDAIPLIVRYYPNVLFLLVGSGPMELTLKSDVRNRGIDQYVQFLGWRSDALDIIEASDLVVHPTLHEAFCSVIIEALSLERPLIATDVAAAPEQIDHGDTGLIVPARDGSALAQGILQILANSSIAAEYGRKARLRVVERYNFPKMMSIYEEYYIEWLNNRLT
jgi:glycosyltransferase involved in cell wall biosynthesis